MKILVIGSMNIDYTYRVPHMLREGETLAATGLEKHAGGKGLNQALALARGGASVAMAGKIGPEGEFLKELLKESDVDVSRIAVCDTPTGHAMIQLDDEGKNSIMIFGGANREIGPQDIESYLADFGPGDVLLLQNEISCRDLAIEAAKKDHMLVVMNPSPLDEELKASKALKKVDIFVLNETEGRELTGETEPEAICRGMREKYGPCVVMLTLGTEGCRYDDGFEVITREAYRVETVDTTGAGDTFLGYFLAHLTRGGKPGGALQLASKAAAIAVTRPGAAASVPSLPEVVEALKKEQESGQEIRLERNLTI